MPMPNRKPGESEDTFVSRFMASEVMKREYPDQKQRLAIAYSQAKKAAKKSVSEEDMLGVLEEIING